MNSRRLKIEDHGEPRKGKIKSKIRLCGSWLEQAGFKPGNHVTVTLIGDGVMELRSEDPAETIETPDPF